MPASFDYAIVRVVPRVEREEFINVGAVVFCAEHDFLLARLALDEARLRSLFPSVDLDVVREHLDAFRLVCAGGPEAGPIGLLSTRERWHWLVAPKNTIIQTSAPHSGLCDDPNAAIERILDANVRPEGDPARAAPVFRRDDLTGAATRALIEQHLERMHAASPPESVHAFDVAKLLGPGVTFWSAWVDGELAGCGALKELDAGRGELKSMRVADPFLGRGIGRAILDFITNEARARGMTSLWLETGSSDPFLPALRLYESAGFRRCDPFDDYVEDPFSVFMTRGL